MVVAKGPDPEGLNWFYNGHLEIGAITKREIRTAWGRISS